MKQFGAYRIFLGYAAVTALCMNMFSFKFGSEYCLWLESMHGVFFAIKIPKCFPNIL